MTRRVPLPAIVALAGFVVIVLGVLVLIPQLLYPPLTQAELQPVASADTRIQLQQAQAQLQNNARSTLLQMMAGILVVTGAIATWRQVQINREGQITERFTRAIDQLGNEKVDVRIGGIYTLERLAKDSAADRTPIGEILAEFVRCHALWPAGDLNSPEEHPTQVVDETMYWLRDRAPDVQAAIAVLGRRTVGHSEGPLELRRIDLRRSNLADGTLTGAKLADSNLAGSWAARARWQRCWLYNTDLRKIRLPHANLDYCDLTGAFLQGADLDGASLKNANLHRASLRGANLRNADLRNADLSNADLCDANLDGAQLAGAQLTDVQTNAATAWPHVR